MLLNNSWVDMFKVKNTENIVCHIIHLFSSFLFSLLLVHKYKHCYINVNCVCFFLKVTSFFFTLYKNLKLLSTIFPYPVLERLKTIYQVLPPNYKCINMLSLLATVFHAWRPEDIVSIVTRNVTVLGNLPYLIFHLLDNDK